MSDPFSSRYNPNESGREHSCVKGETILLGDNKSIQDLSEGNHVLGLTGEVKVLEKMVQSYDGEMIRIHGSGILPFDITPDHPLYVVTSKTLHRGIGFSQPYWKKSNELKPKLMLKNGDYLIMPMAKEVYYINTLDLSPFVLDARQTRVFALPLNDDIAWLLGIYTAEGFCHLKSHLVCFALNKKEKELAGRIANVMRPFCKSSRVFENRHSEGMTLNVRSAILGRAFSMWCGAGALNKKIPDFILFHQNISLLKSFLEGYVIGDGSQRLSISNRKIQRMATVSKLLAFQLQQAYARLGIFANINVQHKSSKHVIDGRIVSQAEAYEIWFVEEPEFTHVKHSKNSNAFYIPVRQIEKIHFEGLVHNVETTDHTYLVNNVVVSNCFGKIKAIRERTGLVLTHDEISYLCAYIWHCSNPDEFYRKMDSMSDDELRYVVEQAKLRKRPSLLEHESMLYA